MNTTQCNKCVNFHLGFTEYGQEYPPECEAIWKVLNDETSESEAIGLFFQDVFFTFAMENKCPHFKERNKNERRRSILDLK